MNYKLSYYTIFTATPHEDNKMILFCSRTGKSLLISRFCYYHLKAGLFDVIPESTLQSLIKYKALVPVEEDELLTVIGENSETIDQNSGTGTLYEVIQPSAMCQLGCYYCGQDHVKHNIALDLHAKLITRVEQKIASGTYTHLFIGWFGGEPLLGIKEMRALTKQLKVLTGKYNMTYSAKVVTNGLSLKKELYQELITELSVSKIEVTLDGDQEHHDKHRYTKGGKGSFSAIFNNLKSILLDAYYNRAQCPISIRCNVDMKNYLGVSPLINLLAENNLHTKIAYFYLIGIYSWGGNEAQKGSLSKSEFSKLEIGWYVEMLKLGFPVGSFTPSRKKVVCMAVTKDSDMYDAYGNIFSCTEVSYSPIYKDNHLYSGSLKTETQEIGVRPLSKWNDSVYRGDFQCQKCKILPVCGGSCPKAWNEGNPACPSMKFNLIEKLKLSYIINTYEKETGILHLDALKESFQQRSFTTV